jgi:hypothetical protein
MFHIAQSGTRRTIEHEPNRSTIPRPMPPDRSVAAELLLREEPEEEEEEDESDGKDDADDDDEDDDGYSE